MAEVVGLVLGVVALAGTFKDCVDLFSYISASRNIGKEYRLMVTKLDVEKILLLQWAERVRLLKEMPDHRLNEPDARDAVSQVLASIHHLLSDANGLKSRYGLRVAPEDMEDMPGMAAPISGPRMSRFLEDFQALSIRTRKPTRQIPVLERARWAIHDKDKFDDLITQLSYFISKLNELLPDNAGALVVMAGEDMKKLNLDRLKMVFDASTGREAIMANFAMKAIEENCQTRILSRFWYRVMDDRRSSVAHAHSKTLHWALKPPAADTEKWDDLSEWLKSGSDIYWLCGKAGSGKSTLMKYLYEHRNTRGLLKRWAGTFPLTMANFFFYALGTYEQRSQEGLSRALLYQILHSEPSLIPKLFPNMWKEALESEEAILKLPSAGEVKRAYDEIGGGLGIPRRFCFFIDGLDEYSGNYFDGISFVKSLVRNPDIKILLSSRPIPACVQAFSSSPQLQLQDLTKEDITAYINDVIGSHSYMKRLSSLEPDESERLVSELRDKASGVFLWVVLACRSLIEGFAAFDSTAELRERVDELPRELEDLFQHMLEKIEPRYQVQGAKMLRICYQNQYAKAQRLFSIGLALVNDAEMDPSKLSLPNNLSATEKRTKCEMLEGRLRSRCCGLLEVVKGKGDQSQDYCLCNASKWTDKHDELIDSTVGFMHRTVYDFLSQPGVWDLQCLQLNDPAFNSDVLLSCLSLQLLSLSTTATLGVRMGINTWMRETLFHAARAESSASKGIIPVLYKLEQLLQKLFDTNPSMIPFTQQIWMASPNLLHRSFPFALHLAVEAGIVTFVRSQGESILGRQALGSPLGISRDMIQYLLKLGCDPNDKTIDGATKNTTTSWQCWLEEMPRQTLELGADVTESFIRSGADLGVLDSESELASDLASLVKQRFVEFVDVGQMLPETQWRVRRKGREILRLIELGSSTQPGSPRRRWSLGSLQSEQKVGTKRAIQPNCERPGKRPKVIEVIDLD